MRTTIKVKPVLKRGGGTRDPPWAGQQVAPPAPHARRPVSALAQHLDKALLAVNAALRCDERISSNPVAKLVFGDPASFLPSLPRGGVAHSSKMWGCRTRVTVEYLRNLVEQRNGKETAPVLWKFLQKVRAFLAGTPGLISRGPGAPALGWAGLP